MTQTINIKLPFKVSTNAIYAGTHWTKRKKYKDMMLWAFIGYSKQLKQVDSCKLKFVFKFAKKPLDIDNCGYMIKLIIDALCHYKIIKDDTPDIVTEITINSTKNNNNSDEVEIIFYE